MNNPKNQIGTSSSAQPIRCNQVEEQINQLANITQENEKLICELESRLQPILTQSPECPPSGTPEELTLVPVAERIREIYRTALRTQRGIQSILSRIEV